MRFRPAPLPVHTLQLIHKHGPVHTFDGVWQGEGGTA